jgi:hypothetical protein
MIMMETIGWAVKKMHNGDRVRRAEWNRGTYIFLVPCSEFQVNRPQLMGIYPEGTWVTYHAHVDMVTAPCCVVPWLCSHADLLATDWEIAD